MGFVQIFSDKTAMTLRCTALLAYAVHGNLLNVTISRRKRSIDNGHMLVGFLPVCCTPKALKEEKSTKHENILVYKHTSSMTVPLESSVRATTASERRERRKRFSTKL